MDTQSNKGHIDWFVLLPIAALMLFSSSFVYSASAVKSAIDFGASDTLLWKHILRIGLGIFFMISFAKIDYHVWEKYAKPIIFIAVILLGWVLIGGKTYNGATRWLDFGLFNVQPSEFAKFALVIYLAALIKAKQDVIKDLEKGFFPLLTWVAVICGLIAMQPNFSTMFVIFIIAFMMLFIGNTNILHIAATGSIGLVMAAFYAVSAEYRMQRLLSFFGMNDAATAAQNENYQLDQALIALGNGGLTGLGPGQNRQSNFLPEPYGDFIFSIIGEEYGFIGLFIILMVFVWILWRGFKIAKNAPDDFGYFLAAGIVLTFGVYVFVNAGVNTGLLPTTGVPMPFISYGGTAVLFNAAAIGILLNVSAQSNVYPKKK